MADHPLRSATHRSLGGPLPHQLANGPRAHLRTTACMQRPSLTPGPFGPVVSSGISPPFERLFQFRRQVAHVLLTRSPLYLPEGFRVRLACVRHAASVRSEPGSNSPIEIHERDCAEAQTAGCPAAFPSLYEQLGNYGTRSSSVTHPIRFSKIRFPPKRGDERIEYRGLTVLVNQKVT